MSDLESNYCEVCGASVESAHAIRAEDGDPFPPAATGAFGRWDADHEALEHSPENAAAHTQVGEREIRVYVHEDGERNG